MRARHLGVLLALSLILTACGFKLRGFADVPIWLNNVALISDVPDNSSFIPVLTEQLKTNGIRIIENPGAADYWLVILTIQQNEQISGVAASTTPRQYQLTLWVDFELKTRQGAPIQKPARVSVTRTVTMNENRILGSNSETRYTVDEMQKDLSRQMIIRLAALRP